MIRPIIAKSADKSENNNPVTLEEHTMNTIKNISLLYNSLSEEIKNKPGLLEAGIIAALFHDIGKSHPEFQKLLYGESNDWNNRRHEIISANYFAFSIKNKELSISKVINGKVPEKFLQEWILPIWLTIILHHKYLVPSLSRKSHAYFNEPDHLCRIPFQSSNKKIRNFDMNPCLTNLNLSLIEKFFSEMTKEIIKLTKDFDLTYNRPSNSSFPEDFELSSIFRPYIMDKSKELSNILKASHQSEIINYDNRIKCVILLGLLKSADHLASMNITPIKIPKFIQYKDLKYPRPFQESVASINHSAILRAPTGAGKTKAAIMWAQNNQQKNGRLIYILPFQASLNAIYVRLLNLTKNQLNPNEIIVGINHSKNLEFLTSFFEEHENYQENSNNSPGNLRSLVREVYFPIKVSTAHQLLRVLLFGKGWEKELLQLYGATVIFDEIHAYEPKLLGLLIGLMKYLKKWNSKILIMTATLPEFIIKLIKTHVFYNEKIPTVELDPNEPKDNDILNKIRHKIQILDSDILTHFKKETFRNLIQNRYKQGKTQLIVCNTVSTAQKLYNIINNSFKPIIKNKCELKLFHSNFTFKDRRDIEALVLSQGKSEKNPECYIKILVATQVVEVSLDINYDYGYFELAPLDNLVQRMGRINRYGNNPIEENSESNIIIFENTLHDQKIYPQEIKNITIKALSENPKPLLKEYDLKTLLEEVYPGFNEDEEKEFESGLNHNCVVNFDAKCEAGFQQEWILDLIQSTNQVEFVPFELKDKFLEYWKNKNYLNAKQLFINTYLRYDWKNALITINNLPSNIRFLKHSDYIYDSELGLYSKKILEEIE